jgi:hypothetical protein
VEAIELAVEGEMPQWLAGKLFRSGPGTLEVETELGFNYLVNHWFDGLTVRLLSLCCHLHATADNVTRPCAGPAGRSLSPVHDQMMHGFEIKDGRVFYANRKAAREVENYIARHGGYDAVCVHSTQSTLCWLTACYAHRDFITFGADPCKSTFDKLSSAFAM